MSIIHLISSPRNVSTALLYFFAKRGDISVLDEPFYAYYLNKHQVKSHPGFYEIIDSQSTNLENVIANINNSIRSKPLFIKNMAQHIYDLDLSFLKDHKVVFLIREPKAQIFSFSKVIERPTIRDLGLKDQYDIFKALHKKHKSILVVDSNILLQHPNAMLNKLCNQLGIPFNPSMLKWRQGPIPEDGIWANYWYRNVHESIGFSPYQRKEVTLNAYLEDIYVKVKPYYDYLYSHAIRP